MDVNSSDVIAQINSKRKKNTKVAFVSGNFNILHPGHLRLLRFAKECGGFVVVGVLRDDDKRVVVPEALRLEGVRAISLVDYAFVLDETPESFINHLRPDFVIKGQEHEAELNPEREIIESYGGKLLFGSGDMAFSSYDLINQELKSVNDPTTQYPLDFPKRHKFSFTDLKNTLNGFKQLKVVVVGDLIVDEYVACEPLGMSQEDPTIVVSPIMTEKFLGGAGIVAAHAAGLGANVQYFGVCGRDEAAQFARDRMSAYGVGCNLIEDESRPTSLKRRYRCQGKTLLRVSQLRQHQISKEIIDDVCQKIQGALEDADMLIFSDFNYGFLAQPLVDQISAFCREKDIPMVADSQSSSQWGDVSRFKGMLLLTPTEREARLATRDSNSGLAHLAQKLCKRARCNSVIVTLASEGLLIHTSSKDKTTWHTDKLPAFNNAPRDVSGGGDSFLTCAALALALENDIWKASYLGSIAAACQVSRVGNIPLTQADLGIYFRENM